MEIEESKSDLTFTIFSHRDIMKGFYAVQDGKKTIQLLKLLQNNMMSYYQRHTPAWN